MSFWRPQGGRISCQVLRPRSAMSFWKALPWRISYQASTLYEISHMRSRWQKCHSEVLSTEESQPIKSRRFLTLDHRSRFGMTFEGTRSISAKASKSTRSLTPPVQVRDDREIPRRAICPRSEWHRAVAPGNAVILNVAQAKWRISYKVVIWDSSRALGMTPRRAILLRLMPTKARRRLHGFRTNFDSEQRFCMGIRCSRAV